MFCDYKRTNTEWICARCGRITEIGVDISGDSMPIAKCRIPEDYFQTTNSNYIGPFKIKGVGYYLADIIKNMGYGYNHNGKNRALETYLDTAGIEWCSNNQGLISHWISRESELAGIVTRPKTIRALVKLSILKARTQEI